MVLEQIFPKETVIVNLESTEKDELFEEMVEAVHNVCPSLDRAEALDFLNDRESKMTTGIMHNVAVPHALISSADKSIGAIGISRRGIVYDSLDKAPVYVVFLIIGASGDTEGHIQILKNLAMVLQVPGIVDKIRSCQTAAEVHNLISSTEESLAD